MMTKLQRFWEMMLGNRCLEECPTFKVGKKCEELVSLNSAFSCVTTSKINRDVTQEKVMPRRSSLDSLQASIKRLILEEKQQLLDWLAQEIKAEIKLATSSTILHPTIASSNAAIVEQQHYEGKTYQLEKRRCGKNECVCMDGEISEVGHGPYWYAYWRESGKLKNMYVGKRAPWETTNRKRQPIQASNP